MCRIWCHRKIRIIWMIFVSFNLLECQATREKKWFATFQTFQTWQDKDRLTFPHPAALCHGTHHNRPAAIDHTWSTTTTTSQTMALLLAVVQSSRRAIHSVGPESLRTTSRVKRQPIFWNGMVHVCWKYLHVLVGRIGLLKSKDKASCTHSFTICFPRTLTIQCTTTWLMENSVMNRSAWKT